MQNIIIQTDDPEWTIHAVHLAAALARNNHAQVTLLHLMLAPNPGLLGADVITPVPTWQERQQFEAYAAVCADYGVPCTLQPVQYVSRIGALKEAVSCLEADALFIKRPHSRFSRWNKFNVWWLKHRLAPVKCTLYLIDDETRIIQGSNATQPTFQRTKDAVLPHRV